MVNRMRSNRSHTAHRRSHHALKGTRLTVSKEGTVHVRHRALLDGTLYRGRSVMDVTVKRSVKKVEKAPAGKKK
mgnify:CR=1 FL=1